jgi:membrane protease YdiL (CAAX protease family)
MSLVAAFVWTFVATMLLITGIQLTAAVRPGSQTDLVNLGTWEALVYGVGAFAVLRVHAPEQRGLPAAGIRHTHAGLIVLGLALGLALQIPAESLRQLVETVWPPSEPELVARAALFSVDSAARVAVIMLVAACLVPLVEEVFFRGVLFSALRRFHGGLTTAIVVAVCFVVSHADTSNWLPLALVAFVLSHLRLVSGSLLPCLALHVGFNAVTVASVLTGISSVTSPLDLAWWMVGLGWIVTIGLVVAVQSLGGRSPEARDAREQDAT